VNKILYLTYDGLTDFLGQSQVLPYLTGLVNSGYDISLISFEKKKQFELHSQQVKGVCEKYGIKWHPLNYTKKPPVVSTVVDLIKLRRLVSKLHRKEEFSIVHCRSYITSLIGLWAKRKLGTKFVFDMRGFWADERIDGNLWNLKNPLYRFIYKFFKKKERQFFTEADYVISLTIKAKEEIKKIVGGQTPSPIEIIPCCVDLDLFDYRKITREQIACKKKQLGIPSTSTVLSYIGSISAWYMVREMLLFFKEWLKKEPDSVFLFITGGEPSEIIEEAKKLELPLQNIKIIAGEHDEMNLLIACGDYSIFFIKPLYSKKASSPTKQGENMAMGKPIVCNAHIGDTDFVIEKYNAGILLSEFTEDAFQTAIDKVKTTAFDKEAIRKGAEEFYSLKMGVEKYTVIYKKLLGTMMMAGALSEIGFIII